MAGKIIVLFFLGVVCAEPDIIFNVEEEQPIGTLIGDISSSSLLSQVNPEEFSTLTYRMLTGPGVTGAVSVSAESGNVYVERVIDREVMCGSTEDCLVEFNVAVNTASNSYISVLTVRVIITDTNDNIPKFPSSDITLRILEGDATGSLYSISSADDNDVGNYTVQTYEIIPTSDIFGLKITRNVVRTLTVKVVLLQKLDREIQNRYKFHVVAKDGGDPANMGTVSVSVEVLDDNDNAPAFLEQEYNVNMMEDTAPSTVILQVLATDADINENGQLFYRFSSHQPYMDNVEEVFSVNKQTGDVTLISTRTYKPGTNLRLYIEASDKGREAQVSQVLVTVHVKDAGNNPPELHASYLVPSNGTTLYVSESTKTGTPLVHISVDDSDTGEDGKVTCSINSTVFQLQNVSGQGYIMTIGQELDRETLSYYLLHFECEDGGSLSSHLTFTVSVTDANDNEPVFSPNKHNASIAEHSPHHTIVTQVSATDADENSIVKYYLHPDAVSWFAIDPNSGVITTRLSFDREHDSSVIFKVFAVDDGKPALTGTCTVEVDIADVNDNAPSFNTSTVILFVMERREANTKVGVLVASDPDKGANADVEYSIAGSIPTKFPFVLYQDGTLRATEVLDREDQAAYRFTARASDQGDPPLTSVVAVVINVVDVNDNRPTFVFPNDNNDSVSIDYLAPPSSKITTLVAYDRDAGINSELQYSIKHGNNLDLFAINPDSGALFLRSKHMIKEDTTFTLTVCARDRGDPPMDSTHVLHVVFVYSNVTALTSQLTSNKFTIILAVVIVFTAVVSMVIISVILFLRHKDREKCAMRDNEYSSVHYSEKLGTLPYVENYNYSSNSQLYKKKKKEVSFSLEEDLDNLFDVSSVSVFNDVHQKQVPVRSQNDGDTSGETSDSGRGTIETDTTSGDGQGITETDITYNVNILGTVKTCGFNNHHGNPRTTPSPPSYIAVCSSARGDHSVNHPRLLTSDVYSISAKHKQLTSRDTCKHSSYNSDQTNDSLDNAHPESDHYTPSYV